MIEITRTPEQVNLDYLIGVVQDLTQRVEEIGHKANKATEDLARPTVYAGPKLRRAQVKTAIGPRSVSTQGTGTVYLAVAIAGTLYRQYPNIVVNVTNDASSASSILVNAIVWIFMMADGDWSVLPIDCDPTPTALSDQPHS